MTITIFKFAGLAALATLLLAGCGGEPVAAGSPEQFKLPKKLREISGLALTPDGLLLGIADEKGVVYQLDLERQKAPKFSQYDEPAKKADFEGLTVAGGNLYATTKEGRLFIQPLGAGPAEYRTVKTRLGKQCEIEGLAARPASDELWFLCKTPYVDALQGKITAFRWDRTQEAVIEPLWQVDLADLSIHGELRPSGLAFSADGQEMWIVAARQHVLLHLNVAGQLLGMKALRPALHPQAEGVIVDQQQVYIADEGAGKRGRISRYSRQSLNLRR